MPLKSTGIFFAGAVYLLGLPLTAQDDVEDVELFIEQHTISEIGGEESSPAEEGIPVLVENAPDNAAGFAVFAKRMPPIPKDALPGRLIMINGEFNSYSMMGMSEMLPELWTGTTEDGTEVAVTLTRALDGKLYFTKPTKNPDDFSMGTGLQNAEYGIQVMALEPVLTSLFRTLKEGPEENWGARRMLKDPGKLMLFAVRLHQAGSTDEANQIAAYLFQHLGDKKQVLMAGLSSLADAAYADLMTARNKDGDNAAFIAGCEALLQEQGRYWRHSAEMAEAIPKWKEMLALPADFVPEVTGLDLDEDQKALYRDLTANPAALALLQSSFQHFNWLLAPRSLLVTQQLRYQIDSADHATKALVLKTHAMGVKALPLFAVMLEDPRFLPASSDDSSRISRQIMHSFGSEAPPLPRPETLRISAIQILDGIKPAQNNSWDEDEPETALPAVMALTLELQKKSRMEVAEYYLMQSQRWNVPSESVYTLLSSDNPDDHEAVMRWLRTSENPSNSVALFLDVHQHKPELAAKFLTEIKKRISRPEAVDRMGGEEYSRQIITRIDEALRVEDPGGEPAAAPGVDEAIQDWIRNNDPSDSTGMMNILTAAKPVPVSDLQFIFARNIQNARSSGVQTHLLQLINRIIEQGGVEMFGGIGRSNQMVYYLNPEQETPIEEGGGGTAEGESLYGWNAEAWAPLLEDDSSPKALHLARTLGGILLANFYLEDRYELLYQVHSLTDEDYNRKMAGWALELLRATDDVPELDLPSSEKVDAERKVALDTALIKGTPAEVIEQLRSSTTSERLVLLTLFLQESVREREDLHTALLAEQNRITGILWNDETQFDPGLKSGDTLSLETLNQVLAAVTREIQSGNSGMVQLIATPMYEGTLVTHQRRMIPNSGSQDPGILVAGIGKDQSPFQVILPVDQLPVTLKVPTETEMTDAADNAMALLMGEAASTSPDPAPIASRNLIDALEQLVPPGGQSRITFIYTAPTDTP